MQNLNKKSRRLKSFEEKKRGYGRKFILIWVIGFIIFFLVPLIKSIAFAFSDVDFDIEGYKTTFIGFKNFHDAFYKSPKYVDNLIESAVSFVYSVPFILALSLIIALLLNQEFKGRMFMRAIFFVPVIISTGVIMNYIRDDALAQQLMSSGQSGSAYFRGVIDFKEIMSGLGLPSQIQTVLMDLVGQIYQLLWSCGVPIILFISGLQSIPDQLYEVSRVEGATKWEEFWRVTFPMLSGTIVLVMVFISLDLLTTSGNPVMMQALTSLQQQIYDLSSAMLWAYFLLIGGGLGIIIVLFDKLCARKWR